MAILIKYPCIDVIIKVSESGAKIIKFAGIPYARVLSMKVYLICFFNSIRVLFSGENAAETTKPNSSSI